MKHLSRTILLFVALLGFLQTDSTAEEKSSPASPAAADAKSKPELNWAQKLFEVQEHDFGVVARGSDVRYRIRIKNTENQKIHFFHARTTCGCATATLSKDTLARMEEGYLEISVDTQHFSHEKSWKAVILMDSPQELEVAIPMKVYIRSDVLLTPGAVSLGSVNKGAFVSQTVRIDYAGRPNWRILKATTANRSLVTQFAELERANGHVAYNLVVTLDRTARPGSIDDVIQVITDDRVGGTFPVRVACQVNDPNSKSSK